MSMLSSSILKKLVMSLSGLFLIVFLGVHLGLNLLLLLPDGGVAFNEAAHFMVSNPMIKLMEPVLAIGFIVHIILASVLTIQNQKARGGQRYASGNKTEQVSFASKHMYVLGFVILSFIVLHMIQFWVEIKFKMPEGEHDTYQLVHACFQNPVYVVIYVLSSIALGYHLCHGFWSAFQTIGLNNTIWMPRLKMISKIYAFIIAAGFSLIAVVQYVCY